MEYKIQAVKLATEIGCAKAAAELGIPENTMYAWTKAAREGRLDVGSGSHTPQTAMNLAEELSFLRRQVKEQGKEIRRLKEELLYGRHDTERMGVEELKTLVWRYFMSYWNNTGGYAPLMRGSLLRSSGRGTMNPWMLRLRH